MGFLWSFLNEFFYAFSMRFCEFSMSFYGFFHGFPWENEVPSDPAPGRRSVFRSRGPPKAADRKWRQGFKKGWGRMAKSRFLFLNSFLIIKAFFVFF